MASRRRGRPRLLTLDELRARNAANKAGEEQPGGGNSLRELKRRYANKLREQSYV